jgi:hypothetical protein
MEIYFQFNIYILIVYKSFPILSNIVLKKCIFSLGGKLIAYR